MVIFYLGFEHKTQEQDKTLFVADMVTPMTVSLPSVFHGIGWNQGGGAR